MNGLVLAGGYSRRMGQPKSLLNYYGLPQYQHCAAMLSEFCTKVFISCRAEQSAWFEGYETIPDSAKYGDIGLLNGVLSAFEHSPLYESWFVLGCDYPLLAPSDLSQLFSAHNPNYVATVFYHPEHQMLEPLVGIYEAWGGPLLHAWYESGNESLRIFLERNEVQKVIPAHSEHLKSVDTPEEYQKIRHTLYPS